VSQFTQPFDRVVADMMRKFGTKAVIRVAKQSEYDPSQSQNNVTEKDYPVKVMFFDFLDKKFGVGTEGKSLIQAGDRQVYVQPPQKQEGGFALPHLQANQDYLVHDNKKYKIVFVKQLNPSMTKDGCVLYELYIRE
jgi:hypothetical protein